MPASFSFTIPDELPLSDSENILKLANVPPNENAFINILNVIIDATPPTLIHPTRRQEIQKTLSGIWNKDCVTFKMGIAYNIKKIYQSFLQETRPGYLFNAIIAARFQSIQHHKQIDTASEAAQFEYINNTHKRSCFMLYMLSIVGDAFFNSIPIQRRHHFFYALFYDLSCTNINISNSLFCEHFSERYLKPLWSIWEFNNTASNFFIHNLIRQSNEENSIDFFVDIYKADKSLESYNAKYYCAIGQYDKAAHSDPWLPPEEEAGLMEDTELTPALLAQFQGLFNPGVLIDYRRYYQQEAAHFNLIANHTNPKRRLYLTMIESFNEEIIGKAKACTTTSRAELSITLKEQSTFLYSIDNIYDNMPSENMDDIINNIQSSIQLLGLAQEYHFNEDMDLFLLCDKVAEKLQTLLSQVNTRNSIVARLKEHFTQYRLALVQERNHLLPSFQCSCTENNKNNIKKQDNGLVILLPYAYALADSQERLSRLTHKQRDNYYCHIFEALLMQDSSLSKVAYFSGEHEAQIKSFVVKPSITTEQLKNLVAILIASRFQDIKNQNTKLDSVDAQLDYFKAVKYRISFMIDISNFIMLYLFAFDMPMERSTLLLSIFTDILSNMETAIHGLFNEHFVEHHGILTAYISPNLIKKEAEFYKETIALLNNSLKNKDTAHCLRTLHKYDSHVRLAQAKYFFAMGLDALAYPFLTSDLMSQEEQTIKQEKENLIRSIQNDTKRTIYIRFVSYFPDKEGILSLDLIQSHLKDLPTEALLCSLLDTVEHTPFSLETPDSIKILDHCFVFLALAQQKSYSSHYNAASCTLLLNKLIAFFSTDKTNMSAHILRSHLDSYKTHMQQSIPTPNPLQLIHAEQRLKALQAQRCALQQSYNSALKTHQEQTQTRDKALQTARSTIASLSSEKSQLIKNKTSLNPNHQQAIKQKETWEKTIGSFAKQRDVKQQEVEQLQTSLLTLQKQIHHLQEQTSAYKQNRLKAKTKHKAQLEQQATHEAHLLKLQQTLELSQTQVQTDTQMLLSVETQLKTAQEHSTQLQSQKEAILAKSNNKGSELQFKLNTLIKKMQDLQREYARLYDTHQQAQQTLAMAQQHIMQFDSANQQIGQDWADDMRGFYKVLNLIVQDAQNQCAQAPVQGPPPLAPPPFHPIPTHYRMPHPYYPAGGPTQVYGGAPPLPPSMRPY